MATCQCKVEFFDPGFTFITEREVVKPQCVICGDVLSNESLKQSELKRHLEAKHSAFIGEDRCFFDRKE